MQSRSFRVFILLVICNAGSLGAAKSLEQTIDNRSVRLNDEANLDVLDRTFATQQLRLFEMDKKHSREVALDKTGGSIFVHPIQQAAGLAAPQL